MKTLKEFLKKHKDCKDGYDFAKNMTLPEFLEKCERGDWILWLFQKMHPEELRELTLAKGHCANTVREYMKDERSIKAVDTAIAFGEGKATREELDNVADAANAAAYASFATANTAYYAAYAAAYAAAYDARAANAAACAANAAANAAACAAYDAACAAWAAAYAAAADAARIKNQKLTADICRKYLPLEIWDLTKL